jgi:hypothetical protein
MQGQWIYEQDDAENGPVDPKVLGELMRDRTLSPDANVWPEGSAEKLPARLVSGLFHRKPHGVKEIQKALLEGKDGKKSVFIYVTDRRIILADLDNGKIHPVWFVPACLFGFFFGFRVFAGGLDGTFGLLIFGMITSMIPPFFAMFLKRFGSVPRARRMLLQTPLPQIAVLPESRSFFQNQISSATMDGRLEIHFHDGDMEFFIIPSGVIGQSYLTKDFSVVRSALNELLT